MTWHVNFQLSSKAPKILVHMGLLQVNSLASFDLRCRKYSCISDMVQSAMCVVGTLREHCHGQGFSSLDTHWKRLLTHTPQAALVGYDEFKGSCW